jgi:uncharacterized delta-60 repeat protein
MIDRLEPRRLLAASLDGSFGPLLADVPSGDDYASEFVVDSDGRVVVAGPWTAHGPQPRAKRVALSRTRGNGDVDLRFGDGGTIVLSPRGMDDVMELRRMDDGKLLLLGSRSVPLENRVAKHLILARLTVSGKIDRTFGDRGSIPVRTPGFTGFTAVMSEVTDDQKVVIAARYVTKEPLDDFFMQVVRVDAADGTIDTTFANRGFSRSRVGLEPPVYRGDRLVAFNSPTPHAVHVRDDRSIDLAMIVHTHESGFNGLVHFSERGGIDLSYAGDGLYLTPPGEVVAQRFAFDANDNAVMIEDRASASVRPDLIYFRRIRPDGTPDTTLGPTGLHRLTGLEYVVDHVVLAAGGKWLTVGRSKPGLDVHVRRFTRNFAIDATFGTSQVVDLPVPYSDAEYLDAALGPAGELIATGRLPVRPGSDGAFADERAGGARVVDVST